MIVIGLLMEEASLEEISMDARRSWFSWEIILSALEILNS
jgi:hypothetical protein